MPGRRPDQQDRDRQADEPTEQQHAATADTVGEEAGDQVDQRLGDNERDDERGERTTPLQSEDPRAQRGHDAALEADHAADEQVDQREQPERRRQPPPGSALLGAGTGLRIAVPASRPHAPWYREPISMSEHMVRDFFLGFIRIHILHHAAEAPVYGAWLIAELAEHGYDLSPGTLYPILHALASEGRLEPEERVVDGRRRKYYRTTDRGLADLEEARAKIRELVREVLAGEHA